LKTKFNPKRLLLEVMLVVALAEISVMLILPIVAPGLGGLRGGLLDVALLTLLSGPAVYWRFIAAIKRGPQNAVQVQLVYGNSRFAIALTAIAQVLGLLITAGGIWWQSANLDGLSQSRFDQGVERIHAEVVRRLNQPVLGLKGARGAMAANHQFKRQAFRAYVHSRDLPNEFPGIRGFGFARRVLRADLDAFVARERADGAPDFTVHTSGDANDLFVVTYVEPLANNKAAWGFDLGQESRRRAAAEYAVATGEATLSDRIQLVQDEQRSPGFLYFLPVYKEGANSQRLAERQRDLKGLLYVPMVASELLKSLGADYDNLLDFELFDGASADPENLMFDADGILSVGVAGQQSKNLINRKFVAEKVIFVGSHVLTLRASSSARFEAGQDRSSLVIIGLGGALVSFLMATAVWLLAVGRQRAQKLADAMTAELNRLALVVQHTDNAVTIADKDMRIQWVNQGFARITGYTPEEALGKTPAELLSSGKSAPQAIRALMDGVRQGTPCRVELINRAKDGREYWADTEVQPTFDKRGLLVGFMEIGTDISRQKQIQLQMEAAIREASALLNTVQTHSIVSTTDARGIITDVNEAFCRISGYSREELMGQSHNLLRSGVQSRDFWNDLWRTISSGKPWRGEICNLAKDGSLYWVDSMIAPFVGEDGQIQKFISIRTEITERKQYEHSLREAREKAELATQTKGQFLANMSHEIRTPMNAILGMLKLLRKTELNSHQRDYADKSEGAAKSLLALINDILDFSKVEAGKMTLDPQPFRLDRLMRDLAVILSTNMGAKGIEVLFDIDPDLPAVLVGDSMRLQQVLINLGGNAVKFTSQGQVVIAVRLLQKDGDVAAVEFSVQDSGIGIAPENQAHIFTGFSQAEASTTRKFGGTGLGLSISQRLVALMGGELRLTSTLGAGSTFDFTLQMQAVVPVPAALESGRSKPVGTHRVLVVDSNPVARELLARITNNWGWSTEVVDSGEAALQIIQETLTRGGASFDVVYMDCQMPGMDGWAATRQLRQLCAAQSVTHPVVVMVSATSRDTLEQRTAEEQAMLNAYLTKPVTASMLLDAVLDASGSGVGVRRGDRTGAGKRRLSGMRILVVEDNLINQQVAEELLMSEGALVSLAANGQLGVDAIAAAAASKQFDAVLMDMQMPVLDGFGATRVIRKQLQLVRLPIIAMTANAMASDRAECLAAGMNEHIGKPFDLDNLVHTLLRVTGFKVAESMTAETPQHATSPVKEAAPKALEVSGLDVAGALARMGGLTTLYLRLAHQFLDTLADELAALRAALSGERGHATLLAHSLKGTAGVLGAMQLSQMAAGLERLCKAGASEAELQDAWLSVESAAKADAAGLQAALISLGTDQPVESNAALPNARGQAFTEALSELKSLLEAEEFSALEKFAELRPVLVELPEELFSPLEEALQDLDIEGALRACNAIDNWASCLPTT
jgi:PAS domain S-box-containing protein